MAEAVSDEHTFMALMQEGPLLVLWCVCGWMCKGGSADDCFDYFDRHVSHGGEQAAGRDQAGWASF